MIILKTSNAGQFRFISKARTCEDSEINGVLISTIKDRNGNVIDSESFSSICVGSSSNPIPVSASRFIIIPHCEIENGVWSAYKNQVNGINCENGVWRDRIVNCNQISGEESTGGSVIISYQNGTTTTLNPICMDKEDLSVVLNNEMTIAEASKSSGNVKLNFVCYYDTFYRSYDIFKPTFEECNYVDGEFV